MKSQHVYFIEEKNPRPRIPPHVTVLSATGLILGVWVFANHTRAKTNAKQMGARSLSTERHFTHIYLHTQTAVDAGDIGTRSTTVNFDYAENRKTLNLWPMPE